MCLEQSIRACKLIIKMGTSTFFVAVSIFMNVSNLGGSERYYWDDLLVQKGFNRIISHYFNKDEFFYKVSLSNEEDLEKIMHSQNQKKN